MRADRDAIRTFISADDAWIKLEIILEARIDLRGSMNERLGVPVLDVNCLAAEKLLANADRGLDDATYARDLIDLSFLAAREGRKAVDAAIAFAEKAYGAAVVQGLERTLTRLTTRRGRLAACARALGIDDLRTLRKGIAALRPRSPLILNGCGR